MSASTESFSDPTALLSRLAAINTALRRFDPEAQVALDPASGRMKVLTVLAEEDVFRVLEEIGESASLQDSDEDAQGDSCCGCGCRSGKR